MLVAKSVNEQNYIGELVWARVTGALASVSFRFPCSALHPQEMEAMQRTSLTGVTQDPSSTDNIPEEKVIDTDVLSSDHLSYVRCNFCNTVLAVRIPCKRMLDTVTVKCGHCNNLSFLSTRPPNLGNFLDIDHHHLSLQCTAKGVSGNEKLLFKETQGFWTDFRKGEYSSSSTSSEPLVPKVPFVVKPPEKKHRLPSTYNRFMKEEIQRIKAANPEIPHREAFSTAAKNWARYLPNSGAGSGGSKN
ncbi:hypothetical protein NC652_026007 [Populus alba x Populus x berolinensis]|nr:hypothetical protein NC652_026007 [Populus alba x Populus x berolinensis]